MSKTYKKKTSDVLEITDTVNEVHVTEEDRAVIQSRLDHYNQKVISLQALASNEQAKLDILDT